MNIQHNDVSDGGEVPTSLFILTMEHQEMASIWRD